MRGATWAEGSFSGRFALRGGLRRLAEVYVGGFGGVFWRHRGVSRASMLSTFVVGVSVRQNISAKRSRRLWSGASFLHDERAALADRAEYVQHGHADLQIHPPTMANDLARADGTFNLIEYVAYLAGEVTGGHAD